MLDIRDSKQIATGTFTWAVVDAESWGEYVPVAHQISTLSKARSQQLLRRFLLTCFRYNLST